MVSDGWRSQHSLIFLSRGGLIGGMRCIAGLEPDPGVGVVMLGWRFWDFGVYCLLSIVLMLGEV